MSDITLPEVKGSDCLTMRSAFGCLGRATGHTTASAIRKTFRSPKVFSSKVHDVRVAKANKLMEKEIAKITKPSTTVAA